MEKEIKELNAPAIDLIADILHKHVDAILSEVRIRFKQIKEGQSSEADRQARNCGQCVSLSTDGTAVFIDGVGEVPLDFSGQARVTSADLDLASEVWAAAQTVPGEGIEDAEDRIAQILADNRQARGVNSNHTLGKLVGYINPDHIGKGNGSGIFWVKDQNFNKPVYEATQFHLQVRGEPVACFKCGHAKHDGECVNVSPQPQQQAGEPLKSRRIDDVVRGLQASVAVGSDGEWVSIRREARDAAIKRLQELNSDCAHMYESYVEAVKRSAPQPPQIPEGYKLVPIEPADEMIEAGSALYDVSLRQRYKAMLEAAPQPTRSTDEMRSLRQQN